MKNHQLDQSELVEAIDSLTAEVKGIEAALREANECVPQLDLPGRDDIIALHEVLTAKAELLRKMAKAKGIALPKLSSPASSPAGAAYSGASSRSLPARNSNSAVSVEREMTATEKACAAKGVSNVEELAEVLKKERWTAQAKRIGRTVLLFLAVMMFTMTSKAQTFPIQTLLSGGTNKITALSSNATIYLACDEYNSVGLQASAASLSGSTSNILFRIYRSVDSNDQESTLYSNLVLPLTGTSTNTVVMELDVRGAAAIRIVPANTNAGGFASNVVLKARFKASKQKITN